jgi:PncC family amidohydrolase
VKEATLQVHGAVSEETAREMAEGVRKAIGSDIGASTTGIAGPGGATPTKPVGLVHFAVSWEGGMLVDRIVFPGGRRAVKVGAAEHVLGMVAKAIDRL